MRAGSDTPGAGEAIAAVDGPDVASLTAHPPEGSVRWWRAKNGTPLGAGLGFGLGATRYGRRWGFAADSRTSCREMAAVVFCHPAFRRAPGCPTAVAGQAGLAWDHGGIQDAMVAAMLVCRLDRGPLRASCISVHIGNNAGCQRLHVSIYTGTGACGSRNQVRCALTRTIDPSIDPMSHSFIFTMRTHRGVSSA